jgi:tRNA(Arg) A34 adenosine deaminase TadA
VAPPENINYGVTEDGFTAAWKRARKANNGGHRVVAASIIDQRGNVLSTGVSHVPNGSYAQASVHAEQHALARGKHLDLRGCVCVIVALHTRTRRHTSCGRPCASCAEALRKAGVKHAAFFVKDTNGDLHLTSEDIEALCESGEQSCGAHERFARQMRLEAVMS